MIIEKSTDQQTLRFMKGLLAFYKKHGKLSPKQIASIDKTWRNQTFSGIIK